VKSGSRPARAEGAATSTSGRWCERPSRTPGPFTSRSSERRCTSGARSGLKSGSRGRHWSRLQSRVRRAVRGFAVAAPFADAPTSGRQGAHTRRTRLEIERVGKHDLTARKGDEGRRRAAEPKAGNETRRCLGSSVERRLASDTGPVGRAPAPSGCRGISIHSLDMFDYCYVWSILIPSTGTTVNEMRPSADRASVTARQPIDRHGTGDRR
jgi:hypothetical protein